MSQRNWSTGNRMLALGGMAGLLSLAGISARGRSPVTSGLLQQTAQPKTSSDPKGPQTANEKAWTILRGVLKEENADKRARAVHALGLLPGSAEAEKSAVVALKDPKPNVRVAAAAALGSMRAESAKGDLEEALGDTEPSVVLAAANSLLLLHDDVGYDTYYEVLTGEKRASKGLIQEQLDTLKNKKKMAQMGFEEGIGFIPFAGIGYEIFKTVTKNDSSPVRAAAAKKLARAPEPDAAEALVKATTDKNWAVRAAALEAIAERGDPTLVPKITSALDDEKDTVRLTAAACIVHLSTLPQRTNVTSAPKP
ncbi:MAG TPA: HEAT repeat domain-containing protein [Methylomirabilota bacterium]|nr:HEAT repeat domain-containing protein [Methylomirabilota bacterium]